MFCDEAVNRFVMRAKAALDAGMEMPIEDLHVHVSQGNDKLGFMLNVSMLPVLTCGNCKACRNYCYAIGTCNYSPDAKRNWAENTALFKRDPDRYFYEIQDYIRWSGSLVHYFRWHVSGEIINERYLQGMFETARKFPKWHFYTYTKMHALVNAHADEIPENMHIMYSHWDGYTIDNPHNFPEFHTKLKKSNTDYSKYFECKQDCRECVRKGRGCVIGETSWILEHK